MTIRTRRVIFYTLVLVFIVLGAGITLYAKGVRIDPKSFAFTSVGGMYISPSPAEAHISLDGKSIERNNGLFQSGTLVAGLYPKNHLLELSHPGYKPWRRTVGVTPAKVSEVQYAVLVPEGPVRTIGSSVREFWLAGERIIAAREDGLFTIDGRRLAATAGAPLGWSRSRGEFLFYQSSTRTHHIARPEAGITLALHPLLARLPAGEFVSSTRIIMDEGAESQVFAVNARSFWLLDAAQNTVTTLLTKSTSTVGPVAGSRARIAWTLFNAASGTSRIYFYDRAARRAETAPMAAPGATKLLRWGGGAVLALLQENGDLYLYDIETKSLVRKTTKARDVFFGSDARTIAVLGMDSVEIFSRGQKDDYARFNVQDLSRITRLTWYSDNRNLFVHYPDRVVLLDLEDAFQEHVTPVAETTVSAYDSETNRFYYLANGAVAVMQFPED